jgi:hypothetical protein
MHPGTGWLVRDSHVRVVRANEFGPRRADIQEPCESRAHVFLCMLAYYVEWHMRDALRELIFDDDDIEGAQATRKSVVAKAQRSKSAKQKDATLRTPDDLPVQSFQDLLKDIATLTRNTIRFESSESEFHQLTESTPLQRRALELLSTHA